MTGWGHRSGIELQEVEHEGAVQTLPVNTNGKVVSFPYWDGASVLECFSHTGSFTLNACKFGAKKVTCLDISEHAIESARTNVGLNGFQDRVEFVVADAFEYLRTQVRGLMNGKYAPTLAAVHKGRRSTRPSRLLRAAGLGMSSFWIPAFAKTKAQLKAHAAATKILIYTV